MRNFLLKKRYVFFTEPWNQNACNFANATATACYSSVLNYKEQCPTIQKCYKRIVMLREDSILSAQHEASFRQARHNWVPRLLSLHLWSTKQAEDIPVLRLCAQYRQDNKDPEPIIRSDWQSLVDRGSPRPSLNSRLRVFYILSILIIQLRVVGNFFNICSITQCRS